MKTMIETVGPLNVPVDESGSAVGKPEPLRLAKDLPADPMRVALHNLYLEAIQYRDSGGRGRMFLDGALAEARRVLEGA